MTSRRVPIVCTSTLLVVTLFRLAHDQLVQMIIPVSNTDAMLQSKTEFTTAMRKQTTSKSIAAIKLTIDQATL